MENNKVIENTTCFKEHDLRGSPCKKEKCRYWIKNEKSLNCTILCTKEGPKTLQEIGDIFEVTRMRICQIEKNILRKLQTTVKNNN